MAKESRFLSWMITWTEKMAWGLPCLGPELRWSLKRRHRGDPTKLRAHREGAGHASGRLLRHAGRTQAAYAGAGQCVPARPAPRLRRGPSTSLGLAPRGPWSRLKVGTGNNLEVVVLQDQTPRDYLKSLRRSRPKVPLPCHQFTSSPWQRITHKP